MAVRGLMIDLLEVLVIKTCDENYLNMYCNACGRYAADNNLDGKESVSVAYCNKALEMLEKFGSLLPPSLLIEFLYRFYSDQSKYLAACGDVQEAIVYAEKSLEICDRGMVEHAEDRSIHICSQLFDLCCELGKREMALEYLQKACEICNEVLAHSDSLDMKRTFSILLEKLAAYCMENQNFEIAKQCMTQSASLTHEIFQAQKDTQSYDDMLHACLCMMQMFDDDSGAVAIWQQLTFLSRKKR